MQWSEPFQMSAEEFETLLRHRAPLRKRRNCNLRKGPRAILSSRSSEIGSQ
jgi:hypothetical protein